MEVLSRDISNLVEEAKVFPMKGAINVQVPTHILYVCDFMFFCIGNLRSIKVIDTLLDKYASCFGQSYNASKSIVYAGAMSDVRKSHIGFSVGIIPFIYLGVLSS